MANTIGNKVLLILTNLTSTNKKYKKEINKQSGEQVSYNHAIILLRLITVIDHAHNHLLFILKVSIGHGALEGDDSGSYSVRALYSFE